MNANTSSEDKQKAKVEEGKACNEEEIVKHMSNLPGFLQPEWKHKNFQEKALNFGVLDWKRLEKWKYNERMPPKCPNPKRQPSLKPSPVFPGKSHPSICSPQRNTSCSWIPDLSEEEKSFECVNETGEKVSLGTESQVFQGKDTRLDIKSPFLKQGQLKFSLCFSDLVNVQFSKNKCSSDVLVDDNRVELQRVQNHFPEIGPQNLVNSQGFLHLESCRSEIPKSKSVNLTASNCKYPKSSLPNDFKRSETESGERSAMKRRHQSPLRFGFGLGKMGWSHSSKESSSVSQVSTPARSGPVMEISSHDLSKNCTNSIKGRSSPLRRLLNPLLKYKGSQSTGVFQAPNGALHSTTPDRNPTRLLSQGLLRVTLKSGLPFFKLVLDDNDTGEVLAAVVKRMSPSGKSVCRMIYEVYSVHEIKKKWIQSTKNENGGLGFTIIGQMKISSSFLPKLHAKDSNHYILRECVLYGVNREQVDKEIAAVVIKSSSFSLNEGDLVHDKKSSNSSQESGHNSHREDEICDSVVVILPGGVHGKPGKGVTSSLISRWMSGGSCDCGGWDIGCKLRVLTNQYRKGDKFLEESLSSSRLDSVNLFVQGDSERKNKPGFNLEAIGNGFYTFKWDSSLSLLEAFATCVSFLICCRFSEILDKNIQEHISIATSNRQKNKMETSTLYGKIPSKYASLPPSSVGRI